MFRIGEFSKIAQVPGNLLRYYDQIGLLKPAHIDQWIGYRYYSARQLPRLHRILALKELGLTLEQIARLVDEEISTAEIRGMLALKKAQVEQAVHQELARLRHIEARLQQIDVPNQTAFDIVLKAVPAQCYLCLREVLPNADAALSIMRELIQVLPSQIGTEGLGYFTTVVYSETLETDRLDIALGAVLTSTNDVTVPCQVNVCCGCRSSHLSPPWRPWYGWADLSRAAAATARLGDGSKITAIASPGQDVRC
jgi:DNA-binding transcriptional MerR regulator